MYLIAAAIFWLSFVYSAEQETSRKVGLLDAAPLLLSLVLFVTCLLLFHFR